MKTALIVIGLLAAAVFVPWPIVVIGLLIWIGLRVGRRPPPPDPAPVAPKPTEVIPNNAVQSQREPMPFWDWFWGNGSY